MTASIRGTERGAPAQFRFRASRVSTPQSRPGCRSRGPTGGELTTLQARHCPASGRSDWRRGPGPGRAGERSAPRAGSSRAPQVELRCRRRRARQCRTATILASISAAPAARNAGPKWPVDPARARPVQAAAPRLLSPLHCRFPSRLPPQRTALRRNSDSASALAGRRLLGPAARAAHSAATRALTFRNGAALVHLSLRTEPGWSRRPSRAGAHRPLPAAPRTRPLWHCRDRGRRGSERPCCRRGLDASL